MSSMHLCQGNWVTIGRAVVYYAWAAHAFSTGVKCWHCIQVRAQCQASPPAVFLLAFM